MSSIRPHGGLEREQTENDIYKAACRNCGVSCGGGGSIYPVRGLIEIGEVV